MKVVHSNNPWVSIDEFAINAGISIPTYVTKNLKKIIEDDNPKFGEVMDRMMDMLWSLNTAVYRSEEKETFRFESILPSTYDKVVSRSVKAMMVETKNGGLAIALMLPKEYGSFSFNSIKNRHE
jgi:hypothetical protein